MKATGQKKVKKGQGKMNTKGQLKVKKQKPGQKKTTVSKKKVAEMSVDDMFSMVEDDNVVMSDEEMPATTKKGKKAGKKKKSKHDEKWDKLEAEEDEEFVEDEDLTGVGNLSRKEYLQQLKQSDPEFYATMMQSDEVMGLLSSDEEEEEGEEEEEEEGGAIVKPPSKLEVDSDESDAEDEGLQQKGDNFITAAMVSKWEEELSGSQPLETFLDITEAFKAAIESLGGSEKEDEAEVSSKYKVEGPQIFNAIIRVCLRKVPTAIARILNLKTHTDDATKSKKWIKHRNMIKSYLRLLVKLTACVAEPSVAEVVLSRGVLPLLPYYTANTTICKVLFRRLVTLWATSEKRVRVMAFICIFRLSRTLKGEFLEWALKRLYLAYVQNTRFTSPSTWGLIDFMRISLVELYALDQPLAYKHAFVYIRQMAIHLRNAIAITKKEQVQLVYNWQFIHCLHLWADLLGKTHPSPALQPIIYPLTQVAIGTMKLQPTPSFYPLVFHVCGILTDLSRQTGTFIPVSPFLLEVLNKAPLEKKHKKASIRPYDWMCMLRLSRHEMTESAFKDGIVDQVYNALVNYMSVESASIAFPELAVPATIQLKEFIKKCKVTNYTKKIKQMLDKIIENREFIESNRKEVTFGIADNKAIHDWEITMRQKGTPLDKHYQNWKKVWEKDQMRKISNRVDMDDCNLPTIKKKEMLKAKNKNKDLNAPFDSDEDDDDEDGLDDETRIPTKNQRPKVNQNGIHDDDDDDDEDDDEDEGDDEGEDNVEPARKKKKKGKQEKVEEEKEEEEEEEDEENLADIDGDDDVVTEMKFSDIEESDDEDQADDYGDMSDDE